MKLLFLLGDSGKNSLERKFAEETEKLIGKDARVVYHDPAHPLPPPSGIDGVWIFTHEEDGGCPEALLTLLEEGFSPFEDVPVVASGVGGKEGGMNAVAEIADCVKERGGRLFEDSEPLCVPLRTARFELGPEERMDLFFLVDEFLKYCGMDDSESRKIAFGTVVGDYFKLLKYLSPSGPKPTELRFEDGLLKTDAGDFDFSLADDAPPALGELCAEIKTLREDYEIEDEEILSALLEKILREW